MTTSPRRGSEADLELNSGYLLERRAGSLACLDRSPQVLSHLVAIASQLRSEEARLVGGRVQLSQAPGWCEERHGRDGNGQVLVIGPLGAEIDEHQLAVHRHQPAIDRRQGGVVEDAGPRLLD